MSTKYTCTTIDSLSYTHSDQSMVLELKRNDSVPVGPIGGLQTEIPQDEIFVTIRAGVNFALDCSFETISNFLQVSVAKPEGSSQLVYPMGQRNYRDNSCVLCDTGTDNVDDSLVWFGKKKTDEKLHRRELTCVSCLLELQSQIRKLLTRNEEIVVTESI